jgi:site-specific DNA-methyltransferase (adenine-specific)
MIDLIHGDCLEEMAKIPSGSLDMVLTDPPYGTTACKWDSIIPLEPMWEQLKRVIKPNGAIVMTASQPFTTTLIASNIKQFKYCWTWDKVRGVGFQIAKYRPMMRTEDVAVFCNGGGVIATYKPQMTERDRVKKSKCYASSDSNPLAYNDGEERVYTHRYPTNVIEVSNASQKGKVHPTQKPVALMEYLIKTYTNEGETVLDFTMGSGTTGVACKNLGRDFIGIEKDDKYFKIAQNRIFLGDLF